MPYYPKPRTLTITYLPTAPAETTPEPITPRRRMGATELVDLSMTGHGWTVEDPEERMIVPRYCRYCTAPLARSAPLWTCEFDGDVTRRPSVGEDRSCECNRCIEATNPPTMGRPRKVCEAPVCQSLRKRDKARAYRARKRALPKVS